MFTHLNGWQRLWVVTVAIYLIPISYASIDNMPKDSDYAQERLYKTINAVAHYLQATNPGYTYEDAQTVRQKYYPKLTDEKIIDQLHGKYKDKVEFNGIEKEYQQKMDRRVLEKAKVLGEILFWWVIPSTLLYLLGVLVAWLIQRFRGRHR